jgi:hypothetical protein
VPQTNKKTNNKKDEDRMRRKNMEGNRKDCVVHIEQELNCPLLNVRL